MQNFDLTLSTLSFQLISDPGDNVAFSDLLFNNEAFSKALYNSLNKGGVFIAQTGMASNLDDPSMMNSRDKDGYIFKTKLIEAGFETIREYEDAHGGFMGVWSFFVAFANQETKTRWYANEAEVNLALKKRARPTKEGKSPFAYFDGATMQSYQYPSRAAQVVFCRTLPGAFGCDRHHGVKPEFNDIPLEDLEVKESMIEKAGLGVFTKVDIPQGSFLASREQTRDIYISPSTYSLIHDFTKHPAGAKHLFLDSLLYGYGFGFHYFVSFFTRHLPVT